MTEMQMRLFGFLRKHQISGASFCLDDVAAYAGYKETSVETMVTRNFLDVWVFPVNDGRYVVRDFAEITPKAFASAIRQTTRTAFDDEGQWRLQLAKLLAHGLQHEFPVCEAYEEILDELTAEAPRLES